MSAPAAYAGDQLRSIVDRILRLKSEQDSIGEDVREVYAEAKSNGFDKTALGRLVTYLRKREKDGAADFVEREALFDIYLETYDAEPARAPARVRAREIIRKSDAKSDTNQGAFEQGDNDGLSARAADASAELIADRGAVLCADRSVAPSAGDTKRGRNSESESRSPKHVPAKPEDAVAAEADGTDGSRPPSHQCVSDGVSTGHPDAGNAPAGVASGVSPAPIPVDATVLLPPLPDDGPLTDERGFMADDLPAFLDRRSAA